MTTDPLGMVPYAESRWLTYKQAAEIGGHVRKSEKSSIAIFWKPLEIQREEDEAKIIPLLRFYHLFNIEQSGGLRLKALPARELENLTRLNRGFRELFTVPQGMGYINPAVLAPPF